jgi:NAD(P)H-hydrate epimerase
MIQLTKVVSSDEMSRIEKLAYAAGASDAKFMEEAGSGAASVIMELIDKARLSPRVTIFAGKGNNGGDGYVCAVYLLQNGFHVEVFQLFSAAERSPLCNLQADRFDKMGGKIVNIDSVKNIIIPDEGVIVDALVGTGFRGGAIGSLAELIEKINACHVPVVAIDIPSGLCGATGRVETVAICADYTLFLELPKTGFFIDKGWDLVGKLIKVSFSLPSKFVDQAQAQFLMVSQETLRDILPAIKRTRHKYEAGYVLAVAGSASMPGAAILSCSSALHAGAGIVRLFHPQGLEESLSCSLPELIKQPWDFSSAEVVVESMKKARSILIGPGLGRDENVQNMLEALIPRVSIPVVLDADALYFLSTHPTCVLPIDAILTPHVAEMHRLLASFDERDAKDSFTASCQKFAEKKKIVLILKGAPTFIFYRNTHPIVIPYGDPGMATAGSGDVLTGVVAALLSQQMDPLDAAVLAVYLHARAGEFAAQDKTSYCMVASDLIDYLPKAFESLL